MLKKEMKISLEQFEATLHIYVQHYVDQAIMRGYSEDEIVALDMEEEDVVFYMSDGEIIRIEKTPILTATKIAEA
tara:strand:- start:2011 stop:2235 length:225 start_codon:yes stop_codon:yes gene_type:complete